MKYSLEVQINRLVLADCGSDTQELMMITDYSRL